MSESLARLCRDPFTAQLLVLIAEQPGISTKQLAVRLNQTQGRTGKHLARLRHAGLLTALIPKMGNQSYGWRLAGHEVLSVEPEPEPEPEPIAATVDPEPEIAPEPIAEEGDLDDGDDEASFSVAAHPSAPLPKGLTPEDLEWHRYWQSRAVQRANRLAHLENV